MVAEIVLLVFAVILIVCGTSIIIDDESAFGAILFLFGVGLLAVSVFAGHEAAEKNVSGAYATVKTVESGTYLVRGQFEDPLKRKVLLVQGPDGKLRALLVAAFPPPETKVVEIKESVSEPVPLKDPS